MAAVRSRERGKKTYAKILHAAEEIFARDGFDAARMEEIAQEVGIQRAGLFYYFKDKRALYRAVLDDVLDALRETILEMLDSPAPLMKRMENCSVAWVEYVWQRPSLARIMLREGAKLSATEREEITENAGGLLSVLHEVFDEGVKEGVFQSIDPLHYASAIIGSTVFLVAAFPTLIPELSDQRSQAHLEAHKREIRHLTRFLLELKA